MTSVIQTNTPKHASVRHVPTASGDDTFPAFVHMLVPRPSGELFKLASLNKFLRLDMN